MEEGGNIIRNIFGKSYKEAESITKDASKGALDFKSPKENTFYGKDGGKKFGDYVLKEEGNKVCTCKVSKKATDFKALIELVNRLRKCLFKTVKMIWEFE